MSAETPIIFGLIYVRKDLTIFFLTDHFERSQNLQPDLNGNPFFVLAKAREKKDWEWKAEIAALISNVLF